MIPAEGLVLRGPLLTSLDPHRARAIEDGFVRIAPDGRIAGAGDWGGAAAEVRGAPVLRVAPALILPAFVDAHVHLPQIDVRGRYGPPLLEWLDRFVFPAEARFADPDHASRVAERFLAALAQAGVGTAAVFVRIFGAAVGQVLPASSREILGAGPSVAALRHAAARANDTFATLVG